MNSKRPGFASLLAWSQFFFFFSGATGLIYQVLWTRRLNLTFGHTVLAVSTVLTATMAGLALGSLLAGRWTDRASPNRAPTRFLADYGYLEAFVGGWALLTLPLLNLAERLYISLSSSGVSGVQLHLACFLMAVAVLTPPTTAMGATVPVLARLLVHSPGEVGKILSRLYGLNTMGALVGAGLGGFLLLPLLGLTFSMVGAAFTNFAIAFGALKQASKLQLESEPAESPKKKKKKAKRAVEQTPEPGPLWLVPLTFALAGSASMAFQVGWNRSVCLAIGSSVYAFSTVLVIFLGGLSLGSLLYPRILGEGRPRVGGLAWLYLGIALGGALTVLMVPLLPRAFHSLFPLAGGTFLGVLFLDVVLVTLLLLPATVLMGLGFPLATALYSHSLEKLGRSVGDVYGANTVGCIAGAFLTGFVLIPHLGAQWSLQLACLVYLVAALALFATSAGSQKVGIGATLALLLATGLLPRWDTAALASGVAVYSSSRGAGDDRESIFLKPAYYRDGLSCAVSFHLTGEFWEIPHMRVNGKVDASRGSGDRLTQYFLGYLPTLLHPQPKRVGVIGLGGGFTVEAVAQCPGVEQIAVAELEPAVVEMGEQWKPFNSRVLEDPRVQIHIQDGRTFVLGSPQRFDVLISEPSNPWIAGIGNLFTRDFYEHALNRLNPGGLMCQWFNIYAVSQDDMQMVLRSFFDVFPQGSVWQSSGGDLVLIGSANPVEFPRERFRQTWEKNSLVQRHFFEAHLYHPDAVPGHYLMSREKVLDLVGQGPFNTDDRPLLEFSAPVSLYNSDQVLSNQRFLWQEVRGGLPPELPSDPDLERMAIYGALNRNQMPLVKEALTKYRAGHPDAFVFAAQLKQLEGERKLDPDYLEKTRTVLSGCLATFPQESGLAAFLWAELEYEQQNYAKAQELYEMALQNPPEGSPGYLLRKLGHTLFHLEQHDKALACFVQSAGLTPTESTALAAAGGALVKLQQDDQALKALESALKRNPSDPLAFEQLSYALFNTGQVAESEQALVRFLSLTPHYAPGWTKLGLCRKVLGDRSGARSAYQEALRLNPNDLTAAEALREL